ncbi:MAG: hypothetical protein KF817_14045 [Phycisphaeraceae bacterium]|nr:hypothetical protein [Phycisphaeraceae bacterium]
MDGSRGAIGLMRRSIASVLPVHPGERCTVLASALLFFFLLGGYYMLRPVREAMGIERGWEDLAWLMTATVVAMLLVHPLFAWLVSRADRRLFLPVVYRLIILCLVLFHLALSLSHGTRSLLLGYAFYVWLSVINLFAVSLFWALMADVHGSDGSRRLFALIGAGGTVGALAGAGLTGLLVEGLSIGGWTARLTPDGMLLAAAVMFEVAVRLSRWLARRSAPDAARAARLQPSRRVWEAFPLLRSSVYLRLLVVFMLALTVTATFFYMEQGRIVREVYPDRDSRTQAFASLDFWTNVVTLALQCFVTAHLVRRFGLGLALGVLPAVVIVGLALLWLQPVLALPAFGVLFSIQLARRAVNYAVARPTREMLFAIVNPDARYKAKSLLDTFVYRGGDALGAWIPAVLARLHVPLGAVAIPLAVGWLGLAWMLGRRHARIERGALDDPAARPIAP